MATEKRLRETAKTATNGVFVKVQYVFLLSMIDCMSIDLQSTGLGCFGQKLIRVFSLPTVSNEHIVGRAQTLRPAVQSCVHFLSVLLVLFVVKTLQAKAFLDEMKENNNQQ